MTNTTSSDQRSKRTYQVPHALRAKMGRIPSIFPALNIRQNPPHRPNEGKRDHVPSILGKYLKGFVGIIKASESKCRCTVCVKERPVREMGGCELQAVLVVQLCERAAREIEEYYDAVSGH